MSLLMIKTKDLTWQDHTLNIESMLAPSRSQLMVNKHKSYDARACTDKDLYDKQKVTRLKDYVIDKRMMERRREGIIKRRREILVERSRSTNCKPKSRDIEDVETKSNHSDSQLLKKRSSSLSRSNSQKCPPIPSANRSSSLQSLNTKEIDIICEDVERGVFITDFLKCGHKLPQVRGRSEKTEFERNVSFVTENYGREHQHSRSKQLDSDGHLKPLQMRIQEFLAEQQQFNEDPSLKKAIRDWDRINNGAKSNKKPQVINRFTTITFDKVQLEKAFDHFCADNSKEKLQKIVKMAAKLKVKVTIARDESWAPTLASIKCSRQFLSALENKQKQKPQQVEIN